MSTYHFCDLCVCVCFRSVCEPLTVIMPDDPVTLPTSSCHRHGVSESGDLLTPRVPSSQHCHSDNSELSQYGAGPPAELAIRPASPDAPQPIKNVHALQQICEEEEENEDENDTQHADTQELPQTPARLLSNAPALPTHQQPPHEAHTLPHTHQQPTSPSNLPLGSSSAGTSMPTGTTTNMAQGRLFSW